MLLGSIWESATPLYLNYPVATYMLKVNNRNTRTRCKIRSNLTIKTPERQANCHFSNLWPFWSNPEAGFQTHSLYNLCFH